PAVAAGRAFVLDGNAYLNRSGPRIIDTLEILAHLIRPDLFSPPEGELAEGRAWARLAEGDCVHREETVVGLGHPTGTFRSPAAIDPNPPTFVNSAASK